MLLHLRGLPMVLPLILTAATLSTGCVHEACFLESESPRTLCDQWGAAVSMTACAAPAYSDHGLVREAVAAQSLVPQQADAQPAAECDLAFFAAPRLDAGQFDKTADWPPVAAAYGESRPSFRVDFPPPGSPASGESDPAGLAADPAGPLAEFGEPVASCETRFDAGRRALRWQIRSDHRNYYSGRTLAGAAYGLAFASILANTSLDQDFQDWYRNDVRSESTDDLADWGNPLGNGWIFIPAFACLAVADLCLDGPPAISLAGDLGCRASRAYLVGAPPMVFLQYLLGATRPDAAEPSSHWQPFDDCKAVSGHAFIGAVPFLTAAKMTDCFVLKSSLYLGSALPVWSRLNDDRHYLSQVLLGWWMAYLACEAVDRTPSDFHALRLVPVASADAVGIGAVYAY